MVRTVPRAPTSAAALAFPHAITNRSQVMVQRFVGMVRQDTITSLKRDGPTAMHAYRDAVGRSCRAKGRCFMPRVCVFDVNETLLDLCALDPIFLQVFGDAAARREWFTQLIHSALVATVTGAYAPFGQIGDAALTLVARRRGVVLADGDRHRLLGGMRRLPPHPDVRPALERLRAAGLRLATLTNSTADVAEAQLAHAGLSELFDLRLSVDAVRRLKPAPEAYQMAAEQLGVALGGVRLIAAHSWDIAGALRAGCAAAFVARPGMFLDPLAPVPDVVGADMGAVVGQILAAEGATP
jgi:2-haloacid dehalogenase